MTMTTEEVLTPSELMAAWMESIEERNTAITQMAWMGNATSESVIKLLQGDVQFLMWTIHQLIAMKVAEVSPKEG